MPLQRHLFWRKIVASKPRATLSKTHTEFSMATPNPSAVTALTVPPGSTPNALPSAQALIQAAKIAIEQDKPIILDYFVPTLTGKAFMGEDQETKEKMLVKSNEEFTSLVQKIYKVANEYIVLTENSLYIVSGTVSKRRIQASVLRGF